MSREGNLILQNFVKNSARNKKKNPTNFAKKSTNNLLTYIEDVSTVGNLDKVQHIFDRKFLVIDFYLGLMLIDIVALSALKQH